MDPNDAETLIRFADFLDLVKPTNDTPVTKDDVVAALRGLRRDLDENRAVVSSSARQRLLDEAVRPFVAKFAQWPGPSRVAIAVIRCPLHTPSTAPRVTAPREPGPEPLWIRDLEPPRLHRQCPRFSNRSTSRLAPVC
jgi:hypothetical protein